MFEKYLENLLEKDAKFDDLIDESIFEEDETNKLKMIKLELINLRNN